jgi:hypothetical protein
MGAMVERFGFSKLALLSVEVRQSMKRIGHIRMLWPQLLLPDGKRPQEERFGFSKPALLSVETCPSVERRSYVRML